MTIPPVSYDARALKINGVRTLLLSGAIHYPRSTPTMWPELMRRSKEAGLNTIETYVFWNLHEHEHGVYDFSDRLDLVRFCQVAQEHDMHVILRIGPYICAETNYGGLPPWLRDVPGIQMRTYNEPFMREMERWVRFLVEMVRPLLASNGGPIILAQLENEYGNIASSYGEEGQRYLQWVSDLGARLDLGVPLVMCVGAAKGALETLNGFYVHGGIDRHIAAHPDQPLIWTEDWPGWYDTFGYPHHVRTPENTAYGVARFIAAGGAGVNYYMWHGGTNFGREAMYLQTTSYDFTAPLNEFGQRTTKYFHLAFLHHLLHEHANLLLKQEQQVQQELGEQQVAFLYGDSEHALTFLCNDATTSATVTFADQSYELAAQSVLLLSAGKVLFNTAVVANEHKRERCLQPVRETFSAIAAYKEPLPDAWPSALRNAISSPQPREQLQFTHDDTDYCWYSTHVDISDAQAGQGTLTLVGIGDLVHIFVDGEFRATSPTPLVENRGEFSGSVFTQSFTLELGAGEHELRLLCCAIGLI